MSDAKDNSRTSTSIFFLKKITWVCVIGLSDKLTIILIIADV